MSDSDSSAADDELTLSAAALTRLEASENGDGESSGSTLGRDADDGPRPRRAPDGAGGPGSSEVSDLRTSQAALEGRPGALGPVTDPESRREAGSDLSDPVPLRSQADGELRADDRDADRSARPGEADDEPAILGSSRNRNEDDENDPFGLQSDDDGGGDVVDDPFGLEARAQAAVSGPFDDGEEDESASADTFAVTLGFGPPDLANAGLRGALADEDEDEDGPLFGRPRRDDDRESGVFGAQSPEQADMFGFASRAQADAGSGLAGATAAGSSVSAQTENEPVSEAVPSAAARVGVSSDARVRVVGPPSESLPVNDGASGTLSFGDGGQRYKVSDNTETVFGASGNVAKVISAYLRQANGIAAIDAASSQAASSSVSVDA